MCSAIDTSIHRGGTLDGQRYLSLGRKAKRDGSCTQNAEERSCSGSYRFRHCDLLSKPPHKIMTPHVELALTHVKNTAGADREQDRCQAAKAKSGKAFLARAFLTESPNCLPRCLPRRVFCAGKIAEVPAAQAQPQKVSDLPAKADMCGTTRDVRFGPIADIGFSNRSPRRRSRAA
jgi:hypothetical protein